EIFARTLWQQGSMSDVDYRNYVALFHCMVGFLRPPDLIVYLKASPATLMERIAKRGRESEKTIGIDYIRRLNAAYDDWMARARREGEGCRPGALALRGRGRPGCRGLDRRVEAPLPAAGGASAGPLIVSGDRTSGRGRARGPRHWRRVVLL